MFAALLLPATALAAVPTFTDDGPLASDAGNFAISWEADGPVRVDIIRPDGLGQPEPLYEGSNHSLFLTGLRDGTYRLVLNDARLEEADTLELTVRHQSLTRALWLVALGALAFIATAVVIMRGARDE